LRLQLAGAAGIGKTRIIASEYRGRPVLWGYHIEFYGRTIKNCRALVDAINAEPIPAGMPRAAVLAGRTYSDEDMPEPTCLKHEIVGEAFGKVASLYKSFCDDGTVQCEHYGKCPFTLERLDKTPKLRAFPHKSLVTPQAGDLKPPRAALAIIDENCIDIVTKHPKVDIDAITDPETYTGGAEDIADHVALGEMVLELLRTVPDVPGKLRESDDKRARERREKIGFERAMAETDHADIFHRLRRTAKAADSDGVLADVTPRDTDEEVRVKLAAITGGAQRRRVATMFRQLARDAWEGRPISYGVAQPSPHFFETKESNRM
jgi:hypothetical protein